MSSAKLRTTTFEDATYIHAGDLVDWIEKYARTIEGSYPAQGINSLETMVAFTCARPVRKIANGITRLVAFGRTGE